MANGISGQALSSFFSSSYQEARQRFLQASWSVKASHKIKESSLFVQNKIKAELFVDALHVLPQKYPKKLLVLSSGIHGPEAYLGSALQLYFLKETLPSMSSDHTGVLLLHSLNPYGFYTGRRVTENNVDLNRNFLINALDFNIQKNPAYEKVKWFLSRNKRVRSQLLDSLTVYASFLPSALLGHKSREELRSAFASGQYCDPKGIYYGGSEYEQQVLWVQELLQKTSEPYDELLLYDVHTGLGEKGSLQMICSERTQLTNPQTQDLQERFNPHEGISVVSPWTQGFYQTSGDFVDFFCAKLSSQKKVAAYTAEFGTLGSSVIAQLVTAARIILENRGHQWGYGTQGVEQKVKKAFGELFNPSDVTWRERAMHLGKTLIEKSLLEGLKDYWIHQSR